MDHHPAIKLHVLNEIIHF